MHCFPKPSYDHTYEKDSTEKHLKHINYSAASVNKNMRTQIDKESYKYELCDYPNREIIMPHMKYRWKKPLKCESCNIVHVNLTGTDI